MSRACASPDIPIQDVYHTYLALAALAIQGQNGLKQLDPAINVSTEKLSRLEETIAAILAGPN